MSNTRKDLIGRFGPGSNFRPAGPHLQTLRHGSRQQVKQNLRAGNYEAV